MSEKAPGINVRIEFKEETNEWELDCNLGQRPYTTLAECVWSPNDVPSMTEALEFVAKRIARRIQKTDVMLQADSSMTGPAFVENEDGTLGF